MSTGRLRLRLLSAGYEEEVLEGMERTALVEAYAQLVAEGAVRPVSYTHLTLPTNREV